MIFIRNDLIIGRIKVILLFIIFAAVTGCDNQNDSGDSDNESAKSDAKKSVEPEKSGVSANTESQIKVQCPPVINTTLSGPDIIGLRLGMTESEAINVILCHRSDAEIEHQENWLNLQTYGKKIGSQMFSVLAGEWSECDYYQARRLNQACDYDGRRWNHVAENIQVATPGIDDERQVFGIWRKQNYKQGEMPLVETLVNALIQKYGAPQLQSESGYIVKLIWMTDPKGAPVDIASELFRQCDTVGLQGIVTFKDICGLTISVAISRYSNNVELVKEATIGMVNQSQLYAQFEKTQNLLDKMEQDRKQSEIDKAKDATDIKL